jgi:hypothetical protein
LKSYPQKKPLLVHLLESFAQGGNSDKAPSPQKIEAPRIPSLGSDLELIADKNNSQTMQQKVDKAQSLLDDMNEEETHGFKLPSH